MIDDIVTRLREALRHEDGYQMTMAPELVSAIADEIERLRADRDAWRKAAIEIASWEMQGNPEAWAKQFYDDMIKRQDGHD